MLNVALAGPVIFYSPNIYEVQGARDTLIEEIIYSNVVNVIRTTWSVEVEKLYFQIV